MIKSRLGESYYGCLPVPEEYKADLESRREEKHTL